METNNSIINQRGGNILASGGFGCIFKPALKCANTEVRNTNKISKLMTKKNATDEYNQIQQFKNILHVIPNYDKYFLLNNFVLCQPDKLTKEDLSNFNKCKPLQKKDITSKNINSSLDKLLTINMPDGGIDTEHFVYNYFNTENIIQLNNSLIDLLVHGILPMNKLHVYHCDVKDSNVLVKFTETGLNTRLIDWGLSLIRTNKKTIPSKLYRRPFQYNVPFSSILFNKEFLKMYYTFLELNNSPTYYQIREFVINYIFIWNKIRGPGHLSALNDILSKLNINDLPAIKNNKIKNHFIEYEFTYYYIVEYLSKILEKYTQNGKINLIAYFNNVFIKNIDIWGFTMIYIVLYEYLYKSFNTLNEFEIQFIHKIKYIIIHFLFENPLEPIHVPSLVDELTKLNLLIEQFNNKIISKQLEYITYLNDKIISGGKMTKTKHRKYKSSNNKKRKKTRKIR